MEIGGGDPAGAAGQVDGLYAGARPQIEQVVHRPVDNELGEVGGRSALADDMIGAQAGVPRPGP